MLYWTFRVEGKGAATILEVAFQSKLMTPQEEEENQSANKDIREKVDQLCEQEKVLKAKTNRLTKQRNVLEGFADSVSKPMPVPANGKDSSEVLLSFCTCFSGV